MSLTKLQINELLDENLKHECTEGYGPDHVCVRIAAIGELPSRFGSFQIYAFYNNRDDKEHAAIVHGDVLHAGNVPVRVHSEGLTGDAIGSLRCDCRDKSWRPPSTRSARGNARCCCACGRRAAASA